MNTALKQLVDYLNKNKLLKTNELSAKMLDDKITDLYEIEKSSITSAWIEGNKQGWAQQTDWPEDAERYYVENFNIQ